MARVKLILVKDLPIQEALTGISNTLAELGASTILPCQRLQPAQTHLRHLQISRYMCFLLSVAFGNSGIAYSDLVAEIMPELCMYQVQHSSLACHPHCFSTALTYVSLGNSNIGPHAQEHTNNTDQIAPM